MRDIGKRLTRDQRGMAFVEFAMVTPIILCLLLGSVLGSGMMLAYLKVNDAAQLSADLITQCRNGVSGPTGALTQGATGGDLQNFANAANAAIYPLNTANMNIAFASVTWNSAGAIQGANGGADWVWPTNTTMFNSNSPVTQVKNAKLIQPNLAGSVVVANLTYTYQLPFNINIPGLGGAMNPGGVAVGAGIPLSESAFSFPRYVSQVQFINTNNTLFCP